MKQIKFTLLILSLVFLVSLVSGATYTGDWSYLLADQVIGTDTTTGATIRVADQQVGAAETQAQGTYSDWVYLENDTFQISVSLISNQILCELDPDYPNTGGGSGYLTLPSDAIMAKTLTGRVDWQRSESMSPAERYLRGTVHVLSYTLDDTPTPTPTPTNSVNLSAINTTPQQIARETFFVPYPVFCVMAVLVTPLA